MVWGEDSITWVGVADSDHLQTPFAPVHSHLTTSGSLILDPGVVHRSPYTSLRVFGCRTLPFSHVVLAFLVDGPIESVHPCNGTCGRHIYIYST